MLHLVPFVSRSGGNDIQNTFKQNPRHLGVMIQNLANQQKLEVFATGRMDHDAEDSQTQFVLRVPLVAGFLLCHGVAHILLKIEVEIRNILAQIL